MIASLPQAFLQRTGMPLALEAAEIDHILFASNKKLEVPNKKSLLGERRYLEAPGDDQFISNLLRQISFHFDKTGKGLSPTDVFSSEVQSVTRSQNVSVHFRYCSSRHHIISNLTVSCLVLMMIGI